MNGHEGSPLHAFPQKIPTSFAESILASSPTKAHGAMGDGCDSGEGEQELQRGEEEEWPQHPALLQCSGRKEGDSGFISPEAAADSAADTAADLLSGPALLGLAAPRAGQWIQ